MAFFIALLGPLAQAAYEKEPIKGTKSDTVAVTEELLKKEGQSGPASPTGQFLDQQPYKEPGSDKPGRARKAYVPWWKRWFYWLGGKDQESH
jgi:hypothetical protein